MAILESAFLWPTARPSAGQDEINTGVSYNLRETSAAAGAM
jgi:hypothetical protein